VQIEHIEHTQTKGLPFIATLGKINSVPGHHPFNHLQQIGHFPNSLAERDSLTIN
jgi:hypothetical protein